MEVHECRVCKERYEEMPGDKNHHLLSKYIHFLGICDVECWNNIQQKQKDLIMFRGAILGDDRKRNKILVHNKHLIKKR
jgi:hypothetical protein